MQKFVFFLTVSFVYLALLHSYSPFERQIIDIKNQQQLSAELKRSTSFNPKHPYSFILTDVYREGVFVKTSFIKLKAVSPFHKPAYYSFKVTSNYFHYLKPYIGFEISRYKPNSNKPSNLILPPGFSFVANPILGYWKKRQWNFYRFYKALYKDLAWDTPVSQYRPTVKEYRAVIKHPIVKKRYATKGMSRSLLSKTRERDNLILANKNLFGSKGYHTPYIAKSYVKRSSKKQSISTMSFITDFYKQLFAGKKRI